MGSVRHLATPLLLIQHTFEEKRYELLNIDGKRNPADPGTKHLDRATMERLLGEFGCQLAGGRARRRDP